MLLVFFLVTTSIDSDKGLNRVLPAIPEEETQQTMDVSERNVLRITIDSDDKLSCEDERVTPKELQERIVTFISTTEMDKHVLSLQVSRNTSYDAYFAMQNAIVAAYHKVREGYARKQFGLPFALKSFVGFRIIVESRSPLSNLNLPFNVTWALS